jgi:hypothetical protein
MPNNILDKIPKEVLHYLKEYYPEEVKTLEKSNTSDLSSKNLSSEVTSIVQKNDDTIQLKQKTELKQELNPEPEDTRSQVEKLVDRLHDNPKELATELTRLSKNNPNAGDELMAALEKHPNLAQDLSPHLPQLQVAQNPPRWVADGTKPAAEQQQEQAAQASFGK